MNHRQQYRALLVANLAAALGLNLLTFCMNHRHSCDIAESSELEMNTEIHAIDATVIP